MLQLIDLSNWKTKKDILKELQEMNIETNERVLRKQIENHNKMFYEHEVDDFIAHSSKGYKRTSNIDEIKKSIKDNKKRSIKQLVMVSCTLKAIGELDNLRLDLEESEVI